MAFEEKVAIVTGAGSGIGAATAKLFAKEGAKVALCARHEDKINQLRDEINKAGGCALALVADTSKEEDIKNLMNTVHEKWGGIDILVCNAGINGVWAPIEELTVEDWDKTMNINLRGTFITLKYAIPYMKEKHKGSIVVISSINGTRTFSNTGATAYSASKAGQLAMVKMLAPELAEFKIRINCVCPGAIETNIGENTEKKHLDHIRIRAQYPDGTIPLTHKEPAKAEEVAKTCLFLANDDMSGHVTGSEMYLDGGESLVAL